MEMPFNPMPKKKCLSGLCPVFRSLNARTGCRHPFARSVTLRSTPGHSRRRVRSRFGPRPVRSAVRALSLLFLGVRAGSL